MQPTQVASIALAVVASFASAACGQAGPVDQATQGGGANGFRQQRAAQLARTRFRTETILDQKHGGLVAMRFAVPEGWRATSSLTWTYSDVSWPIRVTARAEAPDGSAWLEAFSPEVFFWLQPIYNAPPFGAKRLGLIYRPDIGVLEAMQRYIILRYRGSVQDLKFVGWRPVPNLAQALGKPAKPGESIAIRITYTLDGEAVDEEFYGLLGVGNRVPYTGPQGTSYESQRPLSYVHSMGAKGGKLESLYPLLGFVAASFEADPIWEKHAQQVRQQLDAQFNQYIARGYAQIRAAGELSRAITANTDAIMAAAREQSAARSASEDRIHDNFTQYIRGTERVSDPNRGTSEQPSEYRYHWTDALGSVQHSNDPNYNPNIGSTTTWQPMEPLR